jgi:uncharacterized protein (DUF1786 family)
MSIKNPNLKDRRVLAVDVGSGTQDVLLFDPDIPVENCVKMVLPSQTTIVGQRISRLTREGKPIFLTGNIMGGGPCSSAVRKHLEAGLPVFATELAAKTMNDNLDSVRSKGVTITENAPHEAIEVEMKDVDLKALASALAQFGVELPPRYAIAVQDHGHSPHMSNRKFRFQHWKNILESGGRMEDLAYFDIPPYMTRMLAVQRDLPGAMLMDTGSAAIWGAFSDMAVESKRDEGLLILNIGNQHTVGVLVRKGNLLGVFEHHTRILDPLSLRDFVERFKDGSLTDDEVFGSGGHGAYISPQYRDLGPFPSVVTGPQRAMAGGLGYYFAVPNGDMMLAGCFGLVNALQKIEKRDPA